MTELESDLVSSTVHLLHATSSADAAAGSLLLASQYIYVEKPCIELVNRLNHIVDDLDAIRDEIIALMSGHEVRKE